jgi:hypothetical protein
MQLGGDQAQEAGVGMSETTRTSIFRAMRGYPWLNPCPRCGFRGSCDCTVLERARAAHPGLVIRTEYDKATRTIVTIVAPK